jgi:hypothetical protein
LHPWASQLLYPEPGWPRRFQINAQEGHLLLPSPTQWTVFAAPIAVVGAAIAIVAPQSAKNPALFAAIATETTEKWARIADDRREIDADCQENAADQGQSPTNWGEFSISSAEIAALSPQ